MFGISEKEYDRQKHAERLNRITSKSLVYQELLSRSVPNDLVFIGERAIRKSFIHSIARYTNESAKGTTITYFDFELNGYSDRMTTYLSISDKTMSFSEIQKLLS